MGCCCASERPVRTAPVPAYRFDANLSFAPPMRYYDERNVQLSGQFAVATPPTLSATDAIRFDPRTGVDSRYVPFDLSRVNQPLGTQNVNRYSPATMSAPPASAAIRSDALKSGEGLYATFDDSGAIQQ